MKEAYCMSKRGCHSFVPRSTSSFSMLLAVSMQHWTWGKGLASDTDVSYSTAVPPRVCMLEVFIYHECISEVKESEWLQSLGCGSLRCHCGLFSFTDALDCSIHRLY